MFQKVEVLEIAKFYCIKHHLFRKTFVIRVTKTTSKLHMFSSEHENTQGKKSNLKGKTVTAEHATLTKWNPVESKVRVKPKRPSHTKPMRQ